jgi:bacterioferritin (cytochrome b1)
MSASISRRRFIAVAGGSAAAASVLAACGSDSSTGSGVSGSDETSQFGDGDVGILNYFLTLELVEAAFYADLAKSRLLSAAAAQMLESFGEEEEKHADLLVEQIKKLGGKPAAEPGAKFSLESEAAALELGGTLENLGAAAYLGQLSKLESVPAMKAALSIHSVEGKHAAALNSLLEESPTPDGAFAAPATVETVMSEIDSYLGGESAGS